jgi:hypothetical protein
MSTAFYNANDGFAPIDVAHPDSSPAQVGFFRLLIA